MSFRGDPPDLEVVSLQDDQRDGDTSVPEQNTPPHLPREMSDRGDPPVYKHDSYLDTRSNASSHSRHSRSSSITSRAIEARVKAEISQARLIYKHREAKVIREQALIKEHLDKSSAENERRNKELGVDLDIIKLECENAAAQAEIKALEEIENDELSAFHKTDWTKYQTRDRIRVDRSEYTNEFVKGLHSGSERNYSTYRKQFPIKSEEPEYDNESSHHKTRPQEESRSIKTPLFEKNETAQGTNPQAVNPLGSVIMELSQFLLRKDLQLSRFTSFNDRPEFYVSWKATFDSVATQLNLTPPEEIDLLVRYLGPESSKFAASIKSANVQDPSTGLQNIWNRLEERYGRPEMVENALKKKLGAIKIQKDFTKLYDLLDVLSEIESVKKNSRYSALLSYYDSSSGVTPIVNKLPNWIQDKWAFTASKYKKTNDVAYPPFSFFVTFIRDIAETKNDPALSFESNYQEKPKHNVFSRKQDISTESAKPQVSDTLKRCPLHRAEHSLNNCKGFRFKTLDERKKILRENKVCFRCCNSTDHLAKDCKVDVKCAHCGKGHASAMHLDNFNKPRSSYGGEQTVNSNCMTLCGKEFIGRSCSKTVLLDVYPRGHYEKAKRVYCIVDEQSNRTLGTSELFNAMCIKGNLVDYTVSTCSGRTTSQGRQANDLCIRPVNTTSEIHLPPVLECDEIPNELSEIPTPEVAKAYEHLHQISSQIPEFVPNTRIELLLGRDIPEVHHVLEQYTGRRGTPYAQKLPVGWVIVGEVCHSRLHVPKVNVNKLNIMANGRPTHFTPCENSLNIKDICDFKGESVFLKTEFDEQIGSSVEDRQFLKLMDKEMIRDKDGCWSAPLPFKQSLQDNEIPNNRSQAWRRAQILDQSLKKNPEKREHFVTFMDKVLKGGAAKVSSTKQKGCFYLPLFGVYHPKKPNQIRGVFDSSAVYQGVSLNSLLMSGPNCVNSLVGILMRFRRDAVAVTGDIEQMFYRFRVRVDHQDYLRFFWYKNNDPNNEIIEYQMCVHVFGNCASPAVAIYGLNKAVETADQDVRKFVSKDFYIDDALTSRPSVTEAISLMKRTQTALKEGGNIRLHKIASNNVDVMKAFSSDDLGNEVKSLDFDSDALPMQRSLGIFWSLKNDSFLYKITLENKPLTRRGVLSMVNSIFDPCGLISPITITGKILLREVIPPGVAWDEPLSTDHQIKWNDWRKSLESLEEISIPRMLTKISVSQADKGAVYIFSDASEKAIAAVAYLKLWDKHNNSHTGFLMSKAKLAPSKGHTIPRLELCGAVLATELAGIINAQLDIPLNAMTFFTDSKVVLGYICNRTRRFFTYVSNRVEQILKVSNSNQWKYVPTNKNPADFGTRHSRDHNIFKDSFWFSGPTLLDNLEEVVCFYPFPLVNPSEDCEIRPEVQLSVQKTDVQSTVKLGCQRFERFSRWKSLVRAIAKLRFLASKHSSVHSEQYSDKTIRGLELAENFILREVQREYFQIDISRLLENRNIAKDSKLHRLSPFIDKDGLMRVGGRLNRLRDSEVSKCVNPIILPKNNHVSTLLIKHFHESSKHQGRKLTEGAIRNAGFWILGATRAISSLVFNCVSCRKLRGKTEQPRMADLPADRLTPLPAFTNVGIDAFGPWEVLTRKTRGGAANSKRWAILFTCLISRAVHIELVEEMSSSSLINALCRFISIRGPVKIIRSDRGTNFIGAADALNVHAVKVEDGQIGDFLVDNRIQWIFNTPHSSHMGGVWERVIGLVRRILDSIMYESRHKLLTNETLSTFMAEVTAILNNRPLGHISTDPSLPLVLTPSMLLTGKVDIQPILSSEMNEKDAYKAQWKRVQFLADVFWRQWNRDYLYLLQDRRKWHNDSRNVKVGDIVLLKDKTQHRNDWPLGIVNRVFSSKDDKVRNVEIRVAKEGKCVNFIRPVCETVLLIA